MLIINVYPLYLVTTIHTLEANNKTRLDSNNTIMKKGKLLESIVANIHEALKSDSSVRVEMNKKLLDVSGNEREIDVLLCSAINLIPFQVAIECKDYKSPISVEKIDAFKAKCESIPNVNKLIFVAKAGFQKAAIKKANAYGIDLYRMEDVNQKTIENWFSIFHVTPMKVIRKISKLELDFDTNPLDDYQPTDVVIIENGQKTLTLLQLIQDIIDVSFPRKRFRSAINNGENHPETEKYEITISLIDSYIIRDITKSIINSVTVEVTDFYTQLAGEIRAGVYQDQSKNITIPTYTISSPDGNIFTAVLKGDGQIDLFMRLSPEEAAIESASVMKLGTINIK